MKKDTEMINIVEEKQNSTVAHEEGENEAKEVIIDIVVEDYGKK